MVAGVRIGAVGVVLALGGALLGPAGAVAAPAAEGYGKDAWWYKAMGLAQAHKQSTGKGVKIAVIDSKIDISVPELRGQRVIPTQSFCGGPAAGKGSVAEHATVMALNIVGSGSGTLPGGVGTIGIAPDATVLGYVIDDATRADRLQCGTSPRPAVFARAIDAAVAGGADIIVTSSGGAESGAAELEAVRRALAKGVVVVAAAGNLPAARAVVYPAAYPGVVAVAAVDRNAKPWSGNVPGNREVFVISAPGVKLTTGSFDGERWRSGALLTGTSWAAPLVAGGLALVAAKYPQATGNQLIQHLIRNPGGARGFGKDLEYGYGIISVTKMLASDPTQQPDVNPLLPATESVAEPAATTAAPAAAESGTATDVAGAEPVAAAGSGEGGSSGALIGGAAVAVLVIGAAALVLLRRRAPAGGGHG